MSTRPWCVWLTDAFTDVKIYSNSYSFTMNSLQTASQYRRMHTTSRSGYNDLSCLRSKGCFAYLCLARLLIESQDVNNISAYDLEYINACPTTPFLNYVRLCYALQSMHSEIGTKIYIMKSDPHLAFAHIFATVSWYLFENSCIILVFSFMSLSHAYVTQKK